MKDIIRGLNLKTLETADRNEMILLLCKSKAIVRWMQDAHKNETANMVRSMIQTIERYVLCFSQSDVDGKQLGLIWPVVSYIETFYNQNAEKYEPDVTKEEIRMNLIGGELMDVMCKVQTMQQNGWRFGYNPQREMLFNGFNFAAEGYINVLQNGAILEDSVCEKIEMMHESVDKEFCKYWNWSHKN